MEKLQNIHYSEYNPAVALKELINAYWVFEYSATAEKIYHHTVLPDGCPSLILFRAQNGHFKNVNIFGPRTSHYNIDMHPGTVVVGVRFFPGSISNIFGIDADALRDKNVAVDTVIKNYHLASLAEIIHPGFSRFEKLDSVFLEIIKDKPLKLEKDVHHAVQRIINLQGNLKVTTIASECALSNRHLQRKFRKHVGLTLKEFARLRRMRSILTEIILKNSELQDALFKSGYFDQAHFNKDFSMISGLNPTLFKKIYSRISHGNVI